MKLVSFKRKIYWRFLTHICIKFIRPHPRRAHQGPNQSEARDHARQPLPKRHGAREEDARPVTVQSEKKVATGPGTVHPAHHGAVVSGVASGEETNVGEETKGSAVSTVSAGEGGGEETGGEGGGPYPDG